MKLDAYLHARPDLPGIRGSPGGAFGIISLREVSAAGKKVATPGEGSSEAGASMRARGYDMRVRQINE